MKYLAFAMKVFLILTGLFMMVTFPDMTKPPFMSGLAFLVIGSYLALEGRYGTAFSGCIFGQVKPEKKKSKKKKK